MNKVATVGSKVCVCVRASWYSELLSAGLLQPLSALIEGLRHADGSQNYVTPLGMSSVVKHYLSESGTGPLTWLEEGRGRGGSSMSSNMSFVSFLRR